MNWYLDLLRPLVELAVTVAMGVAVAAIRQWSTNNSLKTDQATVRGAAQTAAGQLLLQLAQGGDISSMTPGSSAMIAKAAAALGRVPQAAAALSMTPESMAHIVAGMVGKSLADDPTVPTLAASAVPAGEITRQAVEPGRMG